MSAASVRTVPRGPGRAVPALLSTLLLLLSGCGEPNSAAADTNAPRAVPVSMVAATQERLTDRLRAVGTLLADESVVIRPEIAGRVARIHAGEGEAVAARALLISLDDAEQRARVAEIEATVELNRLSFERARDLAGSRMISPQDYDQARARLKASEATLQRERVLLAKTELRAPFAGVLGLRRISPGAYVQPGQDLVNLEAIDPLKLEFRVAERYGSMLAPGMAVQIAVDAAPGRAIEGRVYAVNPLLDEGSRAYTLRARVPNGDRALRPGMFARVEMALGERKEAVVVPEEAIVPFGDQLYVYRVADGKAQRVAVETGLRLPGRVEVSSGLAAGDTVVTAGQLKLRDGTPVAAADSAATP